MKERIPLYVVVLALCLAGFASAVEYKQESQIGPFNFKDRMVANSSLISRYGSGDVRVEADDNRVTLISRTFYISDQEVWIKIYYSHVLDENLESYADGVLVTKERLCDEKHIPLNSFGKMITAMGIKINDSVDKVTEVYGPPTIIINVGVDPNSDGTSSIIENLKYKEGKVFRYLSHNQDDLLGSEFYFKENKLHSIFISISE